MWARSCGVEALALRVREGDYAKADAIHQFRLMAAPWVVDLERMMALAETDDLSEADWVEFEALQWLIQVLAYSAADIGATEMLDECIAWCEAGYMMDEHETPASLRECFAGKDGTIFEKEYLRDAAAHLQKWHHFQSDAERKAIEKKLDQLRKELPAKPIMSAKVGRNDPCPCGSGKKYKKCCGASTVH
jgi:preprotein translocase subunit SecA